jgi:hypothetical protein
MQLTFRLGYCPVTAHCPIIFVFIYNLWAEKMSLVKIIHPRAYSSTRQSVSLSVIDRVRRTLFLQHYGRLYFSYRRQYYGHPACRSANGVRATTFRAKNDVRRFFGKMSFKKKPRTQRGVHIRAVSTRPGTKSLSAINAVSDSKKQSRQTPINTFVRPVSSSLPTS